MSHEEEYHTKPANHQLDEETVDKKLDNLLEYIFGDEFKEVE